MTARDLKPVAGDYPPLTPVSEYPLHPSGIYDMASSYWACSQPERERDGSTAYDWRCPNCVIAAAAAIVNQGDATMLWTPTGGADPVPKKLSWMVARSTHWGVS